jgi:zinc-ribbon domain
MSESLEPKVVTQYCMYCGTELPKQALFCPSCGQAISQEIPEQPATSTQARASRVPSHSGEDEDLDSSESSSRHHATLWDWLQRFVLYAALPIVTLYPFAVVLYYLQLEVPPYNLELDEDGAMYVMTLVSREYFVFQMFWSLTAGFQRIIPFTIPLFLISFIVSTLGWQGIFRPGSRTTLLWGMESLIALLALGGFILYYLIYPYHIYREFIEKWPDSKFIMEWIVRISGSILGGYLIAKDRNRRKRVTDLTHAPFFVRRWLLRGAVVLYATMVLTLALRLVAAPPEDFPRVEFGENQARERGYLIADPSKVDGYWYILDDHNTIRAIPAKNMQEVQFVRDRSPVD